MLMENQVKFLRPQNIRGASQKNRVEAFSWTAEADGPAAHLTQSKATEASRSQIDIKTRYFKVQFEVLGASSDFSIFNKSPSVVSEIAATRFPPKLQDCFADHETFNPCAVM